MNLYFSCSLTGGREFERIYGLIVDHLLAQGHQVPTAHLARPEVMALERVIDPGEVYQRDMSWIRKCNALIAEVSTPSHGVGYEIAYALSMGKPVLCCYKSGVRVSKILTGNDTANLIVKPYEDDGQLLGFVDRFLGSL
jgi:nucleoside 2-deoxyribosyltransferase